MMAVRVIRVDGVGELEFVDVPRPTPRAGEVIVDVAASGVNRADLGQRAGRYDPPAGVTDVLGLECSGVVSELGEGVTSWKVGDRVCALLSGGGYADAVAVPVGQLLPIPAGCDFIAAAALPEAACTAWYNLFELGALRAGEFVLVHGGSGGVGSMAIQLARAAGATVAVTAGSARKLAACRELGATVLIDYHAEDFVAAVAEATQGIGAHLIFDILGASYLQRNIDCLRPEGTLVVVGIQSGANASFDLRSLIAQRKKVTGSMLRNRTAPEKARIVSCIREEVLPLIEAGKVKALVDMVLPFHRADEAHTRLANSTHIGKLVLQMPGWD